MSRNDVRVDIEGLDELRRKLDTLEKLPQRVVTKAARKGANILKKSTKMDAPEDSGLMKRAIVIKPEKTKTKGKKMMQITFDRAFNGDGQNGLVKVGKNGKRAYYPSSQEYGFRTRNGGYIPGYHFMKESAVSNNDQVERVMIETLSTEIDKLLE